MGVKLQGEYSIVDDGVRIEGRVMDTKISEFLKMVEPFGKYTLYAGQGADGRSQTYTIPNPEFKSFIMGSGILHTKDDKEFLGSLKTVSYSSSGFQNNLYGLGTMAGHGEGKNIIQNVRIAVPGSYRTVKRMVSNSSWVLNANKDGEFNVTLRGLVNRHIMTIVLNNATKVAKYVDFLADKCLGHPKFNEKAIQSYVKGGL